MKIKTKYSDARKGSGKNNCITLKEKLACDMLPIEFHVNPYDNSEESD